MHKDFFVPVYLSLNFRRAILMIGYAFFFFAYRLDYFEQIFSDFNNFIDDQSLSKKPFFARKLDFSHSIDIGGKDLQEQAILGSIFGYQNCVFE